MKALTGRAVLLYASGTGTAFTTAGCSAIRQAHTYDILIRNGIVYDGTLAAPYPADVGIKGDKIVAVGNLANDASQVIDADGRLVTPGFIDVHTHCDLTFKRTGWKRYLSYVIPSWKGNYNYLYQGVTTVITGNCGYGYTDTNEWLDMVDRIQFGTNVCHLVPHGAIRSELFGRHQPHEPNRRQMDLLKSRIAEEMEKGAIGLSTGLEYTPGWLATTDELVELARVVRKYSGIYTSHVRDESGTTYPDGTTGVIQSVQEAIEIGRRAELPVEISHLKISSPINRAAVEPLLHIIEQARDDGLKVTADQYPYHASATKLSFLLPNAFESGSGVKKQYKTRAGRARIRRAISAVFAHLDPKHIRITYYPEKDDYEGKTLNTIAEIEGQSPEACYTDMVCEDRVPDALFFSQDMDVVRQIMPREYIITASDGWTVPKGMTMPHPRIYGSFPRKLRQFALDEKRMHLVTALYSMTGLPADTFNLNGRGNIQKNNYADIAVIDLDRLTDRATYQSPHRYSEGIVHLLVNGRQAIENGKATGVRGGRALRSA